MLIDGINFFRSLGFSEIWVMFWHFFVLEMPRFLISGCAITLVATFGLKSRKAIPSFVPLRISVLLPGHNEADNLARAVASMREQTCLPDQIVIVDDGSTDTTLNIAHRLRDQGIVDVVIGTEVRCGKSAAANLGLSQCHGDIVIIADADTTYDRDAFENILKPFADPETGAVAGNLGLRNHDATLATCWQAIQYQISIALGRQVSDMLGILFIVSGAFGAFRRSALQEVGGWSVGPGEDAELTNKMRRAGWNIRFAMNAWGLTDGPESFAQLTRQRLRWDRSLIRMRWRRFRAFLNPEDASFNLADALGTLDILFYQVILTASFPIYLIWLFQTYDSFAWIIVVANMIFYSVFAVCGFVLALVAAPRRGTFTLLPYVFGYGAFNTLYLRFVRLYACFDELIFRSSFNDNYVPARVRRAARDAGEDQ